MTYSGTLYFDDGSKDILKVWRLIMRDEEVSFHGEASWDLESRLVIDTIARRNGSAFISLETIPTQGTEKCYPVVLTFTDLTKTEDGLFVSGSWKIQGSKEYLFSGELETVENPDNRI